MTKKLIENFPNANIGVLLENELEQAELILAAKDFMDQFQDMAEKIAKMQADVMPLTDSIKGIFGPDISEIFENSMNSAIQDSLESIRTAKDKINDSILVLEGKSSPSDLETNDMDDFDIEDSEDHDMDDSNDDDPFSGMDAASGPNNEPLGRAKKESREYKRTSLTESGTVLLKKESLKSLVSWVLKEAHAVMDPVNYAEFENSVRRKAKTNPAATAGWIGNKKYGPKAMAQLTDPLLSTTATSGIEEGKSFRFDRDDDDMDFDPKKAKKANKDQRKFRKNKNTVDDVIEEVARRIERNIRNTGKGLAAKVISEMTILYPMLESSNNTIIMNFSKRFGMTPAEYSLKKAKELSEAQMNKTEKEKASGVLASVASNMATDKAMANKPVQTAISKMDPKSRAVANKMMSTMRQSGKSPKNVKDFVDSAQELTNENINAAHWPVARTGQYAGTPFETDYGKLKAPKSTKSDDKMVKDNKHTEAPTSKVKNKTEIIKQKKPGTTQISTEEITNEKN